MDSLGDFLAPAVSIEDQARKTGNARGLMLAKALDRANGKLLDTNKSPSRKVGELDNRGSHFYLALYWAEALAAQTEDKELQVRFREISRQLAENETKIVEEFRKSEGRAIDIGGYYHPDRARASQAMRPSATFNAIIDTIK